MKYLLYLLSSLFVLAGCGPDNSQTSLQMELSVDTPQLEFPAEGGEQTFMVTSSEQFYLVPGDKWLSVKKGAKVGGYQTPVTVTVEKMTVAEDRQTRISVVSGEDKVYVDVIQTFDDGKDIGGIDQPAQTMGIGWNLGNHFDAYNDGVSGETVWGNPKASQATFNKVRAAGFSTVRIPVTWLGHIGEAPDYKISEAWLNRVAEVVGYAENAGLFVILNMHHDGADSNHWLDIKTAAKDPEVHKQIKEQIAFYKAHRNLLQYGRFCRYSPKEGERESWQMEKDGDIIAAIYNLSYSTSPARDVLRILQAKSGKVYEMKTVRSHLRIARFGSLIKHISPVAIRSDGIIMRTVDRHFSLTDGREHYVCSGEALQSGIPLAMQYSGTGYNKDIRLTGDFGSTMYTVTEKKKP